MISFGTPAERAAISPLAGQPAPASLLVDLGRLEAAYYDAG